MEIYAKLSAEEEKEDGLRFSEYMENSVRGKKKKISDQTNAEQQEFSSGSDEQD